jgi:hypothetical protein
LGAGGHRFDPGRPYEIIIIARLAQLVRASALQAEGHRFESCSGHEFFFTITFGVENNMIYIHGDSHGDFTRFIRTVKELDPTDILIHVGDFGFYPDCISVLEKEFKNGLPCKVFAIDGNHENFKYLYTFKVVNGLRKIINNLYHVPRGTIMKLQNKTFAFMGGGESIDVVFRKKDTSWWEEERITDFDVNTIIENCKDITVDYLISHVCTDIFAKTFLPNLDKDSFLLPQDWRDISMEKMTTIVNSINPKMHIFGHIHDSIRTPNQISVDIDEIFPLREFYVSSF